MTALGEHMSAGRLDVDEYGERSAKVANAKTRRELLAVFGDLPEPRPKLSDDEPAPARAEQMPVRSSGAIARRALAALLPLSWLAASAIGVFTGYWLVFLVPVALTVLGSAAWGSGMRRSMMVENWMDHGMSGWGQDWQEWQDWGGRSGWLGQWGWSDSGWRARDAQRHARDAQRHARDAQRRERDAQRRYRDAERRDRDAARRARDAARRARDAGW